MKFFYKILILLVLTLVILLPSNLFSSESFTVEVTDNLVIINNYSVYANCCSKFTSDHHIDGNKIIITQRDTSTEKCRCMCNFDLNHTIEQILPGNYTLEIYRKENIKYGYSENKTYLVYKTSFEVLSNQSKSPLAFTFKQSICVNEFTDNNDFEDLGENIEVIPNPGFSSVDIRFTLKREGDVEIKILNILGKEMLRLTRVNLLPGTYTINLNAINLQQGLYLGKFSTTFGRTSSFKLMWSK